MRAFGIMGCQHRVSTYPGFSSLAMAMLLSVWLALIFLAERIRRVAFVHGEYVVLTGAVQLPGSSGPAPRFAAPGDARRACGRDADRDRPP
jgi:hypothetical protein